MTSGQNEAAPHEAGQQVQPERRLSAAGGLGYGFTHPPTRPEAQRRTPGPWHSNEKVALRAAFAFTPRSVHASSHPRTHSTVTSPAGELTRNLMR